MEQHETAGETGSEAGSINQAAGAAAPEAAAKPAAKRGRPALPEDQRKSVDFQLRLTPAQRRKLDQLGGSRWICEKIDAARIKPAAADPAA
jgi:hypothetical protein